MNRSMKALCFLFTFFLALTSFANNPGVSYQGRIFKPDGAPLEGSSVQFRLQVRSPGSENCLLYEEVQTLNMAGSAGVFALTLNDGTGTRIDAATYQVDRIFANRETMTLDTTRCATGTTYTPNSSDGRKLVVYFKDETMAAYEAMPLMNLNYVPQAMYALEAQKVDKFEVSNILRAVDGSGNPATAPALNPTQLLNLTTLLATPAANYVQTTTNGSAALPVVAGNPSSGLAAGQIWYDSGSNVMKYYDGAVKTFGTSGGGVTSVATGTGLTGGPITTTGTINVDVGVTTGKIIQVAAGNKLPAIDGSNLTNITATDASKLPLAGGTMTGPLVNNSSSASTALAVTQAGAGYAATFMGGNVGIGTASPVRPLTVYATAPIGDSQVVIESPLGHLAGIELKENGASKWSIYKAGSSGNSFRLHSFDLGQDVFTATNAGNVGIGTTDPTELLHLRKDSAGQTYLRVENSFSSGGSASARFGVKTNAAGEAFFGGWVTTAAAPYGGNYGIIVNGGNNNLLFGTNNQARVLIDNVGNVGIGTAAPGSTLDVAGAQTFREMAAPGLSPADQGRIYFDSTANKFKVSENNGAYVDLVSTGSGWALSAITAAISTNAIDNTNFAQTWNWSTATTQTPLAMTANALTTGTLLNLTSSSASFNSTEGLLKVANTSTSLTGIVARIQANSFAGSGLTVLADGNVGIGTASPTKGLHVTTDFLVTGSTQIGAGAQRGGRLTVRGMNFGYPIQTNVIDNESDVNFVALNEAHSNSSSSGLNIWQLNNGIGRLNIGPNNPGGISIDTTGKVGIGTIGPSTMLHVLGSSGATIATFSDGGATTCTVTPASTAFACSSDERLKKNIESYSDAASLENILQLRTVTYEWRSLDNGRHTGYIAQELEKVAPEFVRTGEDGFKQVNYTGLVPWITGAIKAFYAEFKALSVEFKASNEIKSREIASVNSRADKLEAKDTAIMQENAELKARLEQQEKELAAQKQELAAIKNRLGL